MVVKRFKLNTIPKLNVVFQGGLGEESMIHIYGPYQAGKTILSLQLIYEVLSQEKISALYIDVESSIKNNFIDEGYIDNFNNRFDFKLLHQDVAIETYAKNNKKRKKEISEVKKVFMTILDELELQYDKVDLEDALKAFIKELQLRADSKKQNCLYLLTGIGLEDMFKLLDIEASISSVGDKLEVNVKYCGDPLKSPLSKFIRKYNIKLIVIDSLGSLIKNMPTKPQYLPARASALNLMLTSFMKMTAAYKLIILATNHESINPIGKGFPVFYGGISVGYSFKYSLHLTRKGVNRILIVERAPHLPDRSIKIPLTIGKDGFHVLKENVEEAYDETHQ